MRNKPQFEEIREAIDAKQRATVWPDTIRNGRSVDAFLWRGDPDAKPIQRAGLLVFGLFFLLFAIIFAAIPFEKNFKDGWAVDFVMALLALLLSLRLFRNAFLRSSKQERR